MDFAGDGIEPLCVGAIAARLEGNALAHQLRHGSRREGASAVGRVTGGPGPGGEASRRCGGVIAMLFYAAAQAVFFGFGAARGSPGGLGGVPGVPRTGPGARQERQGRP